MGLLQLENVNGNVYISIGSTCYNLGLTKGQKCNQLKKIIKNKILSQHLIYAKSMTNGGEQESSLLNIDYGIIWLSGLLFNTENENILLNIESAISEINKKEYDIKSIHQSSTYRFESELRDEIFTDGNIGNIKILEKEKIYDFGRIDLYGECNGKTCCIELKKSSEFVNTKEQLLRYKNSNAFDNVIYCANQIDDDFKNWLKENNIIAMIYKRKLVIEKVC